jgi:5'(3')-deoxyribonucleotidase
MSKPIIALDIDDVLSHSAKSVVEYTNERWGYDLTIDDFSEQFGEMWQVDHAEAERRWMEYLESGQMARYDALIDAAPVVRKLGERYRIIAVTSRREMLLDLTREWVGRNYPGLVEKIISAGIYGKNRENAHALTKADILQEIGAAYLIDDMPKHCNGAAGVGVQAVLFGDYKWGREAELAKGVVRCKDWAAVQEYFDGRDD